MQTLLLGTLYLPSATHSLDLVLEYSITLNATEHEVMVQFGQILTVNVVHRYISVRITGMDLATLLETMDLFPSQCSDNNPGGVDSAYVCKLSSDHLQENKPFWFTDNVQ